MSEVQKVMACQLCLSHQNANLGFLSDSSESKSTYMLGILVNLFLALSFFFLFGVDSGGLTGSI